jgi:hypothetical protein
VQPPQADTSAARLATLAILAPLADRGIPYTRRLAVVPDSSWSVACGPMTWSSGYYTPTSMDAVGCYPSQATLAASPPSGAATVLTAPGAQLVALGAGVDSARIGQRILVRPVLRKAGAASYDFDYFGSECDGGFAQYTRVAASAAMPVQSQLSDAELACLPCAYSTA